MTTREVLISGAGIAGTTAAYWLREAGYTVTVVERARAPRPGGQTVDLRGAGRTVVERMGLLDRTRAMAVTQRGIAWIDAYGRHRAEMPVEAFGGRGIVSADEILRGDLAAILYEAARPGVSYLFDDSITGLEQDEDSVLVSFEKIAPRRFDLVVGADGLRSVVQRLAFDRELEAFHPLGLLNAWFTVPAEIDLDNWYLMYNAPGGRVASIRPGRSPTEQKAALSVRSTESLDREDLGSQLSLLERHFADAGWETPRLLAAAGDASDFYVESMGQVRLDRWSRGRVVLLGDAGYCPSPLTGLGTSMALVGAYILAGELADANHPATERDPVTEAFDRYERAHATLRRTGSRTAARRGEWVRPDEQAPSRARLGFHALVPAVADATADGAHLRQGRCDRPAELQDQQEHGALMRASGHERQPSGP
jgi:2-polyprenyl-6-methoxyphenol hydroxylase-like FAD-dependent oxidoreductase